MLLVYTCLRHCDFSKSNIKPHTALVINSIAINMNNYYNFYYFFIVIYNKSIPKLLFALIIAIYLKDVLGVILFCFITAIYSLRICKQHFA